MRLDRPEGSAQAVSPSQPERGDSLSTSTVVAADSPFPNPFDLSRSQSQESLERGERSDSLASSAGSRESSVWALHFSHISSGGETSPIAAPAGQRGDAMRLSSPFGSPPPSPHPSGSDIAAQARLSRSLLDHLQTVGEEVRDIRIFHFISQQDPYTVSDMRRAAQWVAGHEGGVGRVSSEGLEGRWPDEMDRLPRLAIALGLERLKLSGQLGMPTFEHEDTGLLLRQVRTHLDVCLAQPAGGRATRGGLHGLQERLMRELVGANGPRPSRELHALRLSVEELASRPRHNQRDYVAMAMELALDPTLHGVA